MSTGVMLLTYGSPSSLDDVPAYLGRVRNREVPDDVAQEFRRRYARIGGSPLVEITQRQAAALHAQLNADGNARFVVRAGMRFSSPTVVEAMASLKEAGAERVVAVILSPQFSPLLMGGYGRAVAEASEAVGISAMTVERPWYTEPGFPRVLATRLRSTLEGFSVNARDRIAVLITAHSLPLRVMNQEPGYVEQLKETAQLVASTAGLGPDAWHFAYQSAGHTPEEWLKPDLLEVLPELAQQGYRHALVAPVQFLADHLETLYDLDVAASEQASAAGFETFTRIAAPNEASDLAAVLAQLVRRAAEAFPALSAGTRTTWAAA